MPEDTPHNVLVVEDDAPSRALVFDVLQQAGYRVAEAPDGHQGLLELRQRPYAFDLVLLDIQMPEMDGIALAREIRRDERFTGLPLLALTAFDSPDDLTRILEAGCDAYLAKPISIVGVREIVAGLLADRDRYVREIGGDPTAESRGA